MKIKFYKFHKNAPLQFSKLEEIHYHYYEISLGFFWISFTL